MAISAKHITVDPTSLGMTLLWPVLFFWPVFGLAVWISIWAITPALLLAGALIYAAYRAKQIHVTIGVDGVSIRRRKSHDFVPMSDILGYEIMRPVDRHDNDALVLTRHSGAPYELESTHDRLQEIVAAIGQYKALAVGHRAAVPNALDRGQHDVATWVASLRNVRGYRGPSMSDDQLARLLDDVATAPPVRVAAAIALESAGHQFTRRRLRIAADAYADPNRRAAMEAVAEAESDAALCEALAKL